MIYGDQPDRAVATFLKGCANEGIEPPAPVLFRDEFLPVGRIAFALPGVPTAAPAAKLRFAARPGRRPVASLPGQSMPGSSWPQSVSRRRLHPPVLPGQLRLA